MHSAEQMDISIRVSTDKPPTRANPLTAARPDTDASEHILKLHRL